MRELLPFGIILLVVAAFCAYFGTLLLAESFTLDTYEGKELLTQAEYTAFKTTLASEGMIISKLEVAASAPTLVKFKVSVPAKYPFPYGEKTSELIDLTIGALMVLLAGGVLAVSVVVLRIDGAS